MLQQRQQMMRNGSAGDVKRSRSCSILHNAGLFTKLLYVGVTYKGNFFLVLKMLEWKLATKWSMNQDPLNFLHVFLKIALCPLNHQDLIS